MSNILTGTFYYLYHYLLTNTSVIVNVKADLFTLLHTGFCIDYSILPIDDKSIIQEIIQILLGKSVDHELVGKLTSDEWWDELIGKLYSIALSTPPLPIYRAFQQLFEAEFKEPRLTVWEYGPYDDTVNYANLDSHVFDGLLNWDNFELWQQKIMNAKTLFIPSALPMEVIGGGRSIKKTRRRNYKKIRASRSTNGKSKTSRRRS
jgi:hypothetical protein